MLARSAAAAASMWAMVAGPAVCSAAAVSASEYIAAAACSRVNGSCSAAAALCADTWAPSRRRIAERMSTAVGVGFGGGEVDVVFVFAAGARNVELLAGEPVGADDVAGAVDVAPAGGHTL